MSELHKGHRDRLRNRFLSEGLNSFADHNKLELLLFYAIPRRDTNETAHELLNHFGSLSSVLDAPVEELETIVGPNAAVLLKLIPPFASAYLDDQIRSLTVLDTADKAGTFLIPKFVGHTNEVFLLISLNAQRKVLSCDLIHEGEVALVHLPIRKIVETCIRTGAVSVILAHNHPGGVPLPSRNDIIASIEISKVLRSIGVEVADHMIVAGREYMSIGATEAFFGDIELR